MSGAARYFSDWQGRGRRRWESLQSRMRRPLGGKRAAVHFRCAALLAGPDPFSELIPTPPASRFLEPTLGQRHALLSGHQQQETLLNGSFQVPLTLHRGVIVHVPQDARNGGPWL
jgi:hypothetical protein